MFHSQPQTHNFTVSQPATHTQTAEEIIHHYANPSLLMCPMDPHRGTDPDRQCSHLDLSIIYGCWSMTACANAVPWLPTRGYWPMTANAATWITRDWPITATWVTMVLAHHCQCSHLDHKGTGPSLPMQPPGSPHACWPVTANAATGISTCVLARHCQCSHLDCNKGTGLSLPMRASAWTPSLTLGFSTQLTLYLVKLLHNG